MNQAAYIIEKFGGTSKLAAALGFRPQRVSNWKMRGFIPSCHHAAIITAPGSNIAPEDFVAYVKASVKKTH